MNVMTSSSGNVPLHPPRRSWGLIAPTIVLLLTLVLALLPPASSASAQAVGPCPQALPLSQVRTGATGTGLTVSKGTTPESFNVKVVGILNDALAPGVPLILVETDSPEIRRVGGIWAGMSGSPVYINGRLLGAVGYGFSFGPSTLAGVTPAAAMLEVPDRPRLAGLDAPAEIPIPPSAEVELAGEGITLTSGAAMRQLEVPVRLSGLPGARFEQAARAFEKAHPGTSVVRGAAGSGGTSETMVNGIVPGGNLAVSMAFGDFNAVGVGTATTVCNGVVTGFGHPMLFAGATRLGMHGASAVRVVDDSVFGPYKLANPGPVIGTIDQDRLAAVAGRLGPRPLTTVVTSRITNRDDGRTTTGRTDNVFPDDLFSPVLIHGWNNYDLRVFDTPMFSGTSTVTWTITGTRSNGSPWSVTRENRHADRFDLSTASVIEAALSAQLLHDNPFDEVQITSIDYRASAGSPYRALEILGDQVTIRDASGQTIDPRFGVAVEPGSTLRVQVPLRAYRGEVQTVDLTLRVPLDAAGFGELTIRSGQIGSDPFECMWDPESCAEAQEQSFDGLLAQIADQPRADELIAELRFYDDGFDEGFGPPEFEIPDEGFDTAQVPGGPAPIEARVRLSDVVSGGVSFPAFIDGEPLCAVGPELDFIDVDPSSFHAVSISCAAALGFTNGVSSDPPLFAPSRPVRRDEAASFIARVLDQGTTPLPEGAAPFADLEGNPHAQAINQLAAAGIVRGRTATSFDPTAPVTRAQVATLLVEATRWATGDPLVSDGSSPFPDVRDIHRDNIAVGVELGLVQGRADGSFQPGATARRDQMATWLLRLHQQINLGID
jgi:hypothetical protein